VLIVDVQLAGTDGIALLQQALEVDSRLMSIVMTGHGNIELAVRAMKSGAADFSDQTVSKSELVRRVASRDYWNSIAFRQENTVLTRTLDSLRQHTTADGAAGRFQPRESALRNGSTSPNSNEGVAEGEKRVTERVAALRQREQAHRGVADGAIRGKLAQSARHGGRRSGVTLVHDRAESPARYWSRKNAR
jgi:flagellar assembly protein FliH